MADEIKGMLDAQIEFSKAMTEIYRPISGRVSDPNSIVPEGNPEGIAACEEYEEVVRELQALLKPELEMIETRVIGPAVELLQVIKQVGKIMTKRDHKQLDYDRTRTTLKKLQDKKEHSVKDEKATYKAESDLEASTQEYQYFNDLLKDELPRVFELEREFIIPLFQSFYYMQLNVFYTLHERMQAMDIGYFNLQADIEDAFHEKRGEIQEETEKLAIVHFKAAGGRRPGQKFVPGMKMIGAPPSRTLGITAGPSSRLSSDRGRSSIDSAPPAYGDAEDAVVPYKSSIGKAKPPPPKPKPARLGGHAAETCTALYDYEAQAQGDLSFAAGDQIEVVSRTSNENEWWTGKVDGREGQFPGKFLIWPRTHHIRG